MFAAVDIHVKNQWLEVWEETTKLSVQSAVHTLIKHKKAFKLKVNYGYEMQRLID